MAVVMCHVIPVTMSSLCIHVMLIARGTSDHIIITPETLRASSDQCSQHSLAASSPDHDSCFSSHNPRPCRELLINLEIC